MYYSESLESPVALPLVKRLFGIDPVDNPTAALAAGIYPLTDVAAGYGVSHFVKEDNDTYTAVPNCVTLEEQQMVGLTRQLGKNLEQIRQVFGLPATQEAPQAIDGYYPLYTSEAESDYHSSNGESHEHELNGVTYYMPDAGVTLYHGNYEG